MLLSNLSNEDLIRIIAIMHNVVNNWHSLEFTKEEAVFLNEVGNLCRNYCTDKNKWKLPNKDIVDKKDNDNIKMGEKELKQLYSTKEGFINLSKIINSLNGIDIRFNFGLRFHVIDSNGRLITSHNNTVSECIDQYIFKMMGF